MGHYSTGRGNASVLREKPTLADVLADHYRLKQYRRKELPEIALTDAERIRLAEMRRRERHAFRRQDREWRRRYPLGGTVDGLHYDAQYRALRIWAAPGESFSMDRTVAFAARHWPRCRRVITYKGDMPDRNYVQRGERWESLLKDDWGFVD